MPQNNKDSNGGKNKPLKDGADTATQRDAKASANSKSGSPVGTQPKGEKKTTP